LLAQIRSPESSSASQAADAYFTSLLEERAFAARASAARAELRKKVAQQEKLLKQLESDLKSHEEAEQHKHIGDLLLANLTTGRREGKRVELVDYFADDAATIQIDLDDSITFQEEANRRFKLYSRSKRAVAQIKARIATVEDGLRELKSKQASLEQDIDARHLDENHQHGRERTGQRTPFRRFPAPGVTSHPMALRSSLDAPRTTTIN
jgi:predicted ribosome quality control (RQC) complex YloA/Tae2 family protein